MRQDIKPGAIFPDCELTDHTAKRRSLSELQGPHPMVLVLSRGSYCPKEHRQAELLVQFHREMEVGYCRLVTISTDNITLTNEYRSGVGAHWPFLSDPGRIIQKDLDIAEYTDPAHNPMIPYVIVLEPGLIVRSTTATGSSVGRRSRISARTSGPSLKIAGPIGISPPRK
jgi:peroxiredoxin